MWAAGQHCCWHGSLEALIAMYPFTMSGSCQDVQTVLKMSFFLDAMLHLLLLPLSLSLSLPLSTCYAACLMRINVYLQPCTPLSTTHKVCSCKLQAEKEINREMSSLVSVFPVDICCLKIKCPVRHQLFINVCAGAAVCFRGRGMALVLESHRSE